MLVLSRKIDESIIIADDVTITVLSITGKQVKIGIAAPTEVSVHREEVYQRLKNEQAKDDTQHNRLQEAGE